MTQLPAHANPLRTERIESVRYRFSTGDWSTQLSWLEQLGHRAAIVGPKGSGKTTLLAELNSRLGNTHYLNLPHERDHHEELVNDALHASKKGRVLLVDGVERLTWIQREQLYFSTAASSGFVVVVHQRCRLPTWVRCKTDESLMSAVLDDLGLVEREYQSAGRNAFRANRGNIRDALRQLYDLFADRKLAISGDLDPTFSKKKI